MSATESEKVFDKLTTAKKEPVDQTSDVASNEPSKENVLEKPIVNEASPQLAKVDDEKLPSDELLILSSTDSHNTQSQLITVGELSQADELLNSILTSTDDIPIDHLFKKTDPAAPVIVKASESQDIPTGLPTNATTSSLELVDEAVNEELANGNLDVKQDNVAASEMKSQEDEVMECEAPAKEKPQVITLDDDVAMKDDTKENKMKKLENTQVRDHKVVGFTPLDNFGIPLQQDHFDKFGLNTKVCVMYKKHFEGLFAMDSRRKNTVIVNVERMRNLVNRIDEERMKKYVYDAKLKTWMNGKLETADKKVLPVNLPGHHVPGYLKDDIAKNVKETVDVQKQEKARQLMEKVGTTESDPSQIRAPFFQKRLRGGAMGDPRQLRQQREGKSILTLGSTGVQNPKPTRAQKRLQRRLVAKESATATTAATSAPLIPTPTATDSTLSEVVTEAGGPSFAPIVFSPTTLTAEVTASASGMLEQPNDEGNNAIAIDKSALTPVKSDPKKNDNNRHKNKEKRTESFPRKPRGDDRNRHGRGPQHSDRRGRAPNGPRRDRDNNRRPEPSNNRKRVRSPPRRGNNVFPNEKRVRVWDNQGSRSAYPVEPSPFARSLFQVPYHPPSLMGADSYASSRRTYPDFLTMSQSPVPPFGTAQSGFPVYSESAYGSSARNDKYGQSASFGGAQAYQQTPSAFGNERDTLSEIRRIERELATIRQHQNYGNTGSSSASTRSSALPVSPPKSFPMYGSSNSALGGSSSYNYSGSSDKQPPKRFSDGFGY